MNGTVITDLSFFGERAGWLVDWLVAHEVSAAENGNAFSR